jgi:hypothetical protein
MIGVIVPILKTIDVFMTDAVEAPMMGIVKPNKLLPNPHINPKNRTLAVTVRPNTLGIISSGKKR